MIARLPMIVFGFFMMAGPAFAGGGADMPPPPEITPPAKISMFDGKRTELYCKLCEGECAPQSGYKVYKFKYVRQWHNYSCRKINLGSFGTRSYGDDENQQ